MLSSKEKERVALLALVEDQRRKIEHLESVERQLSLSLKNETAKLTEKEAMLSNNTNCTLIFSYICNGISSFSCIVLSPLKLSVQLWLPVTAVSLKFCSWMHIDCRQICCRYACLTRSGYRKHIPLQLCHSHTYESTAFFIVTFYSSTAYVLASAFIK